MKNVNPWTHYFIFPALLLNYAFEKSLFFHHQPDKKVVPWILRSSKYWDLYKWVNRICGLQFPMKQYSY